MANIVWGELAKFGLRLVQLAIPQVGLIESIYKSIPGLKGKAKTDAVLALVKASIETAEGAAGKELVNDPAVEAAVRGVVEAYVALQNAIASTRLILKFPGPAGSDTPKH